MTTLNDIATPSNFAALKAVFRSMMPSGWTQSDGNPGQQTSDGNEYVPIKGGPSPDERAAVRAWWQNFLDYANAQGGSHIVWRTKPVIESEHNVVTGEIEHWVFGRLFIPKAQAVDAPTPPHQPETFTCPLCEPGNRWESQEALDEHLAKSAHIEGAPQPSRPVA